jgi:hypothetical protein
MVDYLSRRSDVAIRQALLTGIFLQDININFEEHSPEHRVVSGPDRSPEQLPVTSRDVVFTAPRER